MFDLDISNVDNFKFEDKCLILIYPRLAILNLRINV